jgi:hypothetical protein
MLIGQADRDAIERAKKDADLQPLPASEATKLLQSN